LAGRAEAGCHAAPRRLGAPPAGHRRRSRLPSHTAV